MELKLVWGPAVVVNLTIVDSPGSYYIIIQKEQRVEKSIGYRGDVHLLSPPMISEFRANFSERNFHVNYKGAGTETEKAFCFPWEDVIFTKRVLSRLTAPLTWAASLGWTSAVTCCNFDFYREYYVPVGKKSSFLFEDYRTLILLVPSLRLSFIWNVAISNYRNIGIAVLAQLGFCLILFYHAYLTPPSIRVIQCQCAEWF